MIRHARVLDLPDQTEPYLVNGVEVDPATVVQPSDWDAAHVIDYADLAQNLTEDYGVASTTYADTAASGAQAAAQSYTDSQGFIPSASLALALGDSGAVWSDPVTVLVTDLTDNPPILVPAPGYGKIIVPLAYRFRTIYHTDAPIGGSPTLWINADEQIPVAWGPDGAPNLGYQGPIATWGPLGMIPPGQAPQYLTDQPLYVGALSDTYSGTDMESGPHRARHLRALAGARRGDGHDHGCRARWLQRAPPERARLVTGAVPVACLEPRCTGFAAPGGRGRCVIHRQTTSERGYGAEHVAARVRLAATLPQPCGYGCGALLARGSAWVAAHVIDGDASAGYVVSCGPCNERAKRGQSLAAPTPLPTQGPLRTPMTARRGAS